MHNRALYNRWLNRGTLLAVLWIAYYAAREVLR